MSLDSMMAFRVSYLRLVARAWNDPEFHREMTEASDGWECFGRQNPCPDWDVELRFQKDSLDGNGYKPALTGGWVGPNFRLEVPFPNLPQDIPLAEALAAYYAILPSPFGIKDVTTAPPPDGQPSSVGSGGEGMGHESDAFVLGATLVRALALYWADEKFAKQLLTPSEVGAADALVPIQNWLGYSCPWNMSLTVVRSPATCKMVGKGVCSWQPKLKNRLTLFVPNPPKEPASQAMALAAYNQTGDAYPLTCP